ncbi:hypothetical protein HMPREF9120_01387 [Neisseria sp. oral taxon 020 str. F0370]|nr:hypothetical protein HMPREF9120_01387 [Neisseria sp. oral taxon 020 str. F0370]
MQKGRLKSPLLHFQKRHSRTGGNGLKAAKGRLKSILLFSDGLICPRLQTFL